MNGKITVNSRDIAERFGKRHDKLISEIERMYSNLIWGTPKMVETPMFWKTSYTHEQNKQIYTMYEMNRDGFSLLVMGFTGKEALEWKLKYIEAFNKMESLLKEQSSKALPATYKEALIQLLDQVEKNEQLEEENKVLLPKATYHDKVLNKEGLITTTLIAKDLGLQSASKLNQVMFLNKIIYKAKDGVWHPYSEFEWLITKKYADYKSYEQANSKQCLKWTELGRQWIIEHYKEWSENI